MRAPSPSDRTPSLGHVVRLLLLLWLTGVAIRIPLLDVPPVLPLVRQTLGMSETEVGLLSGLPLVLFALTAVVGSLLIARFGATRTLIVGLMTAAVFSAARGGAASSAVLYAVTAIMSLGISIVQPAIPFLVRDWLPDRIGLATAVSTNGFVIGATVASGLTIPYVLPLVDGSWRLALAIWAVPVLATGVLVLALAPRPRPIPRSAPVLDRRWMPDWKSPLTWMLGLTFGATTAVYFGTNAFLPDYLHSIGRPDLVSPALAWLNFSQVVASFVLLLTAERLQRRAWSFLVFGPLAMAGLIGIMVTRGDWIVVSAGVVGFACAVTFVITLALPPVLSPAHEVHRTAAGMFTISYSSAVVVPIVCGSLWDFTGMAQIVFVPFLLCQAALTVLGPILIGFPLAADER